MSMYDDATERMRIDRHDLDGELVESAVFLLQLNEEHTTAIGDRDQAAASVKRIEGDRRLQLREDLYKEHDKYPTEKTLDANVEADEEVAEARAEYLSTKLEEKRWADMRDAWRMRSHALRDLVQLHLSSHYAIGSTDIASGELAPHEHDAVREEQAEQRRNKKSKGGDIRRRTKKKLSKK